MHTHCAVACSFFNTRPFLTLPCTSGDFFTFMRRGMVRAAHLAERLAEEAADDTVAEFDAAEAVAGGSVASSVAGGWHSASAMAGWRARLQTARREAAAAVREQMKAAAAGGAGGPAAVAEWRASMEGLEAASEVEARAVARALLRANFGGGSVHSWYSVFKAMDRDDSGRVTWAEFVALCRTAQPRSTTKLPRIDDPRGGGIGGMDDTDATGRRARLAHTRPTAAAGPLNDTNLRRVWKRLECVGTRRKPCGKQRIHPHRSLLRSPCLRTLVTTLPDRVEEVDPTPAAS